MLHIHFVKVDHESLLVIGSLGIQVSSSYASGRETTTFIEMSKIKDIVINEAIYMVNLFSFCRLCAHLRNSYNYSGLFMLVMSVYAFVRWVDWCLMLFFQHHIIYYLCVLLKDPSEPNAVSSVVPLFQVRLNASDFWNNIFGVFFLVCLLVDAGSCHSHKPVSNEPPFCIFQSSKPRLNCLVKVYKSCQEVLSKCSWHTSHALTMSHQCLSDVFNGWKQKADLVFFI